MTNMTTKNYAELAEDSYKSRADGSMLTLGDNKYKVLKHVEDASTGYAGTIYQDVSSRQIIVAHRGTEPSDKKDVITDVKMVTHRVNDQLPPALALMDTANKFAEQERQKTGSKPEISTTGHSLGGTLAELTSYNKGGLPGHSFNGYGAVEVQSGMTEGQNSHNFKAHYRVSDVVGTGGRHYGESIPYATGRDVQVLLVDAGYENKRGLKQDLFDDRNPFVALTAKGGALQSHSMGAFIRSEGGEPPVLTNAGRKLAETIDPAADRFRNDVREIRTVTGIVGFGLDGIKDSMQRGYEGVRESVIQGKESFKQGMREAWESINNSWPLKRSSLDEGGAPSLGGNSPTFSLASNSAYQNVVKAFNNSGIDANAVDQRVVAGLAADPKGGSINFAAVSSKDSLQGFGMIAQSPNDPGAQRIDFNANGKSLEDIAQRLAQQSQPSQITQIAAAQPNQELEQPQRKAPSMTA
jgi:hypothetical protein